MVWGSGYIAVDWGTTNRRAYLIDSSGRLADSFADDCGIKAVPPDEFDAAAAQIRGRLGERPMLLAGMVGSNRGWREAPYVPCPAGAGELARAILWVEPGRTGIVPGLSQSAPDADVMRGEEVQVVGGLAAGLAAADATICHPGTHAKWILTDGGRIASFRTMMTGELFALLRSHSILSEQLQGEVRPDASFAQGVDDALEGADLLSGLFRIRARHVLGEPAGEPAAYASGLLIGSDIASGLNLHRAGAIVLIGRPDLCALYAAALHRAGHETTQVDGAEAFLAGIRMLTERLDAGA
jgi:2-dehydro-3-deoxygalactonokinase